MTTLDGNNLRWTELGADAWLAVGRTLGANVTVLRQGREALLIDGLGGEADARELAETLKRRLGLSVARIVATHYFSDHMAAYRLFPRARILAHEACRETFAGEQNRTEAERAFFVEPTEIVAAPVTLPWGRFRLDVFTNPGMTPCMLNVDLPELDLAHAGDNVVGPLVFLRYADPEEQDVALERLERLGRARLLTSHGPPLGREALAVARYYVRALREAARRHWEEGGAAAFAPDLAACLAPGTRATAVDAGYHAANLAAVVQRGLWRDPQLKA